MNFLEETFHCIQSFTLSFSSSTQTVQGRTRVQSDLQWKRRQNGNSGEVWCSKREYLVFFVLLVWSASSNHVVQNAKV